MPVHFENDGLSPGLKRGGVLNVVRHTVEVYTDPEHIPEQFTADLADLDFNDAVRWEDLQGTEQHPLGDRPQLRRRDRGSAHQDGRGRRGGNSGGRPVRLPRPRRHAAAGGARPAPARRA